MGASEIEEGHPCLSSRVLRSQVPLCYLAERGQQIKVFSQLTRKARELNFMTPVIRFDPKKPQEGGYEGATVLSAQIGAYYTPITALDFESLYPSIMMAHNLCFSTLIMNPRYDNLPGVEYETFGTHKFAQNVPSLLPVILAELKAFRNQAKKDMKNAKDDTMKNIYNGKQLAYKVSMNSVYGCEERGLWPLFETSRLFCLIGSRVPERGCFRVSRSRRLSR